MESPFLVNSTDGLDVCIESQNVSDITVTESSVLCAFIGFLSLLIMCGNLLVIISIIYFKQFHTPTNYLILSLAVADLLVGVFVLPFSAVLSLSSCWYSEDLLCKARGSIDISLCATSILHLCFISVDRYYAVCQPLVYKTKINTHVIVIMIISSWSISALNGIGVVLLGLNNGQSSKKCVLYETSHSTFMGLIFIFYIPVFIMFTVYMKIFTVAQRQARSIENTACHSTKSGETISKREKKATKTLAVVMGVFLTSWTPFFICITFHPFSNYTIPDTAVDTFKWFGWSNSMLNPFVYAFFYSWFRTAFKMIITGKIFQSNLSHSKLL